MKRADKADNNKNTVELKKNTFRRSIFSAYFLKNFFKQ